MVLPTLFLLGRSYLLLLLFLFFFIFRKMQVYFINLNHFGILFSNKTGALLPKHPNLKMKNNSSWRSKITLHQQGLGSTSKVRSLRLTSPGSIPATSGLLLVGCCVRDLRGTQVRALAGTSVVLVDPVPHMVYTNPGGIIQP